MVQKQQSKSKLTATYEEKARYKISCNKINTPSRS